MNGVGQWNLVSYLIEAAGAEGTVWSALIVAGGILLCMVVSYLLGSLNFGLIISQRKFHDDVRTHGSGNAGTTNMLRTYGKGAAVLTLLGDMLKALIAVGLGHLIFCVDVYALNEAGEVTARYFDPIGASVSGISVMLGHMFPCFFKFKGGKGVATAGMVVLMLDLLNPLHNHIPVVFLICFAVFVIIIIGTKYVSLGSIMGMSLFPIVYTAFNGNGFSGIISVAMAVLVVWAHRENIKRLKDKKESKLSFGKGKRKDSHDTPEEEKTSDAPSADEKDYAFITCTGCGRLIPQSRKVCAYCKTENKQYIPAPEAEGESKSKKKGKKK